MGVRELHRSSPGQPAVKVEVVFEPGSMNGVKDFGELHQCLRYLELVQLAAGGRRLAGWAKAGFGSEASGDPW